MRIYSDFFFRYRFYLQHVPSHGYHTMHRVLRLPSARNGKIIAVALRFLCVYVWDDMCWNDFAGKFYKFRNVLKAWREKEWWEFICFQQTILLHSVRKNEFFYTTYTLCWNCRRANVESGPKIFSNPCNNYLYLITSSSQFEIFFAL